VIGRRAEELGGQDPTRVRNRLRRNGRSAA
jgi:hypothetical protein